MKLEEMSNSKKLTLSITFSLLIVALFISLYFLDNHNEINRMKNELKALSEEIDRANKIVARYEELKALNEVLKKKMEALTALLPKEAEVSGVLRQVSEIGYQRGLTVSLWRPQQKNVHVSNEIYEIPVEVVMRGKYHTFGNFFSQITGMERILNLKKIELRSGDKDPTLLNVNLTAVTYSMISEEEKKKIKQAK